MNVSGESGWSNYFNYFTEIEEHFQRARGTSLFLLSPLDWALVESWKNSNVPLEAVLRGIDAAFEKWRSKRSRVRMVNSLAYCAQAVITEAQRLADGSGRRSPVSEPAPPFPLKDLRRYIEGNAASIRASELPDVLPIADVLDQLAAALPSLAADL